MTCSHCGIHVPYAGTLCPGCTDAQRGDRLVQIATLSGGLFLACAALFVWGFFGWVIGFWSGATVGFMLGQGARLLL